MPIGEGLESINSRRGPAKIFIKMKIASHQLPQLPYANISADSVDTRQQKKLDAAKLCVWYDCP